MRKLKLIVVLFCASLLISILASCMMGTVVGADVDTTLEVAKVPLKVYGDAVELVTLEGDEDD